MNKMVICTVPRNKFIFFVQDEAINFLNMRIS